MKVVFSLSIRPFRMLHNDVAGGVASNIVDIINKHAISCNTVTFGDWERRDGDDCGILFMTLIQIANAFHIPLRYFIDPTIANDISKYSMVIDAEWIPVNINVKRLVSDIYIQFNCKKGKAAKALGMKPERLTHLMDQKIKNLGMTTANEVVKWLNLVDGDAWKYIEDQNYCAPSVDDIEKLVIDKRYNSIVAEAIPIRDNMGLLRECQKRAVMKRWEEDHKK